MLNDFCKPGGKMVLPGYEKLVPPQLQVIEARARIGCRDHLVAGHAPHQRDAGPRIPEAHAALPGRHLGCRGDTRLCGPTPTTSTSIKRRFSGFFNTDLDLTLKDLGAQSVVVFGVVTNICVRSTVHDAFFHGYNVIVPEDCCAATGAREQASSLYDIGTHFGTVSDAATVAAALLQGTPIRNKRGGLMRLAGKVAVITGAANGIGAATARSFVAEGAKVILADRDAAAGGALAQALGEAARIQRCDVAKSEDIATAIAVAERAFGGLDILVNNAAIQNVKPVSETSEADGRRPWRSI